MPEHKFIFNIKNPSHLNLIIGSLTLFFVIISFVAEYIYKPNILNAKIYRNDFRGLSVKDEKLIVLGQITSNVKLIISNEGKKLNYMIGSPRLFMFDNIENKKVYGSGESFYYTPYYDTKTLRDKRNTLLPGETQKFSASTKFDTEKILPIIDNGEVELMIEFKVLTLEGKIVETQYVLGKLHKSYKNLIVWDNFVLNNKINLLNETQSLTRLLKPPNL